MNKGDVGCKSIKEEIREKERQQEGETKIEKNERDVKDKKGDQV